MNTPTLVAVCGLPGAGKTTVAAEVADRLDAAVLRTDVVRKELFRDPDYTDAEAEAVYAELFERAGEALGDGNVVLDATFRTEAFREGARDAAREADADFLLVSVECEEAVARERIRSRTDDESDADIRVYELMAEEYEPIAEADVVVDNSGTRRETFVQLDGL